MSLLEKKTLEIEGNGGSLLFDVVPGDEYIRVTLGKEVTMIKQMDLWAMVFAISGPEEQEKMMPVRKTELTTFTRVHRVQVKKGIGPGGYMNVKCRINVPTTVVEGINGMLDKTPKKSQFEI